MGIDDLPTGEERTSPFRRPGFLAAAVFLAVVVVLAAVLVIANGGGKATTPVAKASGGQPTASGQSTATSAPGALGNACGLSDTSQTVPTSTPPNIKWELVSGTAVPTSSIAGPGKESGGVPSCFAHTPLGALLAVSQIGQRMGVATNSQIVAILKSAAVPGPVLDSDIARLSSMTDQGGNSPSGQLAGFQFVSYQPDTATINIVVKMPDSSMNTATFTLRWYQGDWKIQLQSTGADSSNVSQITSLDGYVPWSGLS
ncbi:hypothetical protein ACFOSC_29705 [Streptantibioticus rubrisoli]|uniref:DUF8175 domain-containing protein n=1 Tax=Streptantibioticus rubrisoli TaxID=1387313 RepID=A0ABT1PFX7_9ACTN|nr:hypothetical protein [Streptantibioticus rubrisoli]MCQ4044277.1 hypothetical protein [Streptantibioticus rubrisoli]